MSKPSLNNSEDRRELLEILTELDRRKKNNVLKSYFPDKGKYRRELYPKHVAFMAAGATYLERAMIAGNRTGKSITGGVEMTYHLTGLYPDWWEGRRFDHKIMAWAAGKTSKSTRDVIQKILLGSAGNYGTGMIPKDLIVRTTPKAGIPDAVEDVFVRHISGELSQLGFKSYDQDYDTYMGVERHIIWLDEEPPEDIYAECIVRTMTVEGLIMCTFTPMDGLSKVVLSFMPSGRIVEGANDKYIVQIGWDEVPHLSEEYKRKLLASIPEYQKVARSKGIPSIGAGAIYPYDEDEYAIDDIKIQEHWLRIYGLDVGWNKTAGVWLAWDRETNTIYVYSEHYLGRAEPVLHAESIRSRGEWIPGAIDPSSQGRGQKDGDSLLLIYQQLGLRLFKANNAVDAGIYKIWHRFGGGKIKIFRSCQNLLAEIRLYRRDSNGKVVKENDHLCDALRYAVMELDHAICEPFDDDYQDDWYSERGRSVVGGY